MNTVNTKTDSKQFDSTVKAPRTHEILPVFTVHCAVGDSGRPRSGVITPLSYSRARENLCSETTLVPIQRVSFTVPAQITVPDCTPGYKTCEWNDGRQRHNFPLVTKQREVWIFDRPIEGRANSADVDNSFLDSLTSGLTITQTSL